MITAHHDGAPMSTATTSIFRESRVYASFATRDLATTRAFYTGVLGLEVTEGDRVLFIQLADCTRVVVRVETDHVPSSHPVLNFPVPDIDVAADRLLEAGIRFEIRPDVEQDEWGIVRPAGPDGGPPIAWIRDPGGNLLAVLEPTR
jgi:catechol 2,3-dioxygenase-like lactoylglutathione lyase family enzyme